jgi:hypothetical protein
MASALAHPASLTPLPHLRFQPHVRDTGTLRFPAPTLEIVHHTQLELGFDENAAPIHLLSDPDFDPQPTPRSALPHPRMWAGKYSQAALEVLAGRRNVAQLVRWSNRPVYAHLERRYGQLKGAPRVMKVHLCEPADGIAEATVIFSLGARVRAVAARLEGLDGRWITTSFIVG